MHEARDRFFVRPTRLGHKTARVNEVNELMLDVLCTAGPLERSPATSAIQRRSTNLA